MDLRFFHRQRRLQSKHIPVVRGRLADNPFLEHLERSPLAKDGLRYFLHQGTRVLVHPARVCRAELDPYKESAAAHFTHKRMARKPAPQSFQKLLAPGGAIRHEVFIRQDAKGFESGDTGERVSRKSGPVEVEPIHGAVCLVMDLPSGKRGTYGRDRAAQGFGQDENVRLTLLHLI